MILHLISLVGFFALAGIAWVPERAPMRWLLDPGATGAVARRILAFILLVSPVAGALALHGELSGLYDGRFEIAALVLAGTLLLDSRAAWIVNGRALAEAGAALTWGRRLVPGRRPANRPQGPGRLPVRPVQAKTAGGAPVVRRHACQGCDRCSVCGAANHPIA